MTTLRIYLLCLNLILLHAAPVCSEPVNYIFFAETPEEIAYSSVVCEQDYMLKDLHLDETHDRKDTHDSMDNFPGTPAETENPDSAG